MFNVEKEDGSVIWDEIFILLLWMWIGNVRISLEVVLWFSCVVCSSWMDGGGILEVKSIIFNSRLDRFF